MSFQTISQFDQKYKTLEFKDKRNACSVFSLYTVYAFLNNNNISIEQYNHNLDEAVKNINKLGLPKFINFAELLNITTNYSDNNVKGTVVELISEYGYDDILSSSKNHGIIFLKNGNFVAILSNGQEYYVRDCHETTQYNFSNKEDLINHLNIVYKFNQPTIVDGVHIEEFSNIEYAIFEKNIIFKNNIFSDLVIKNAERLDEFIKDGVILDQDTIINSLRSEIVPEKKDTKTLFEEQMAAYDPKMFKEMFGFDLDISQYL